MKEELVVQYHIDGEGRTVVTPLDDNKQPKNFSFVLDEDLTQVKGRWSITPAHDLKLTLGGETESEVAQELILQGEILSVEAEGLSFSFGFQDKEGKTHIRVLKFGGTWAADESNRLSFHVARRTGSGETLTLDGLWEVGENHEILYHYQRKDLKTGAVGRHTLAFKGVWKFSERDFLEYLVEGDSQSRFRFHVMLTETRVVASVGAIQFQVGIDVGARGLPHVQDITLFGKWKIGPDFSVTFSITYENSRVEEWQFGATTQIASKTEIAFNLKGKEGELLGFEVIFSKKLLQNQGEIYLKLRQTLGESAVEGGLRFLWGIVGLLFFAAAPLCAAEQQTTPAAPTAAAAKGPKAEVAEPNFDFGRTLAGPSVKHVYEVDNAGDANLAISNPTTSCGCTTALLDQPNVPPGGKARVQVTFSTQGRSGAQTKVISFTTNDPAKLKVELRLSGMVQAPLLSNPEYVYFTGGKGNAQPHPVQVQNFTHPQFQLQAVSSSSPFIEVAAEKPFGTVGAFQSLSVSIKKGYPHETVFERVAVFTNDPLQPIVWIPVWGRRE